MTDGFPLIAGLTETAPAGDSVFVRLHEALAARPGGAQTDLLDALSSLERAYGSEANAQVRARIKAAQALLAGCDDALDED